MSSTKSLSILLLATVVWTAGWTAPALAMEKGSIQLTPMIGLYNALSNNLELSDPQLGFVELKHGSTLAFGGRITGWLKRSVALEATGIYVPGTLEGNGSVLGTTARDSMGAYNFFASGRIVLAPGGGPFMISAGLVAASTRYDDVDGTNFMAGVVGVGLLLPLGESAGLRLDVDDYLYDMWWEVDSARSESIRQHDIVTTVGISFDLGD